MDVSLLIISCFAKYVLVCEPLHLCSALGTP